MKPRKEDFDLINKILELYVQEGIRNFDTLEISRELGIENGHARLIRDTIRDLNEELSFFRVQTTNSGDLFPLEDGKFHISRFLEDGGCHSHFEDSFSPMERVRLSQKIDDIVSGQILLAEGQNELNQQIGEILPELKAQLSSLSKKVWGAVLRDSILSAGIGLGVNTENLKDLVESVEKSFDI